MEQLEEHDDVAIEWHAFELHPAGAPPISPERQARIIAGQPLLQKRAREHYGLEMNPGPVGTKSRPALVLEKYAQTQGKGAAFHVAAMRAYWEQGKDIGEIADEAKDYARKNPGQAILISAVAGVVLGFLLRGGRR